MYGAGRTLLKVAGRSSIPLPLWKRKHADPDIAIVGCGQFALSTVGYFIWQEFGPRILACFDPNPAPAAKFARTFGVRKVSKTFEDLLTTPGLRTIYITSNHASHAPYALEGLARNLDVYVEKPIAVNEAQLTSLIRASRISRGRVFAGYNRPFSAAIRELRREMSIDANAAFSIQCFVAGHKLPADHWYRRPEEGSRICGNLGHWLDLVVHLLSWRAVPDVMQISLAVADPQERDDNICVTMTSDRGDLCSIMLTSRCEPFEGINETIHLQHANTICKIDDFRHMTIWQGDRLINRRYWPKDVGHRLAVMQPFSSEVSRKWGEIEISSLLMLHIADMVREGIRSSEFSFREASTAISTLTLPTAPAA